MDLSRQKHQFAPIFSPTGCKKCENIKYLGIPSPEFTIVGPEFAPLDPEFAPLDPEFVPPDPEFVPLDPEFAPQSGVSNCCSHPPFHAPGARMT